MRLSSSVCSSSEGPDHGQHLPAMSYPAQCPPRLPIFSVFPLEGLCPLTPSPRSLCCPWACARAAQMPSSLANRACFHVGTGLCLPLEGNHFPKGQMASRGQAREGKLKYICPLCQRTCRRGFCAAEGRHPDPLEAVSGYTLVSFLLPWRENRHRQSRKAPSPHSEIPSLTGVQLLMLYAASLALNTPLLLLPGSCGCSS